MNNNPVVGDGSPLDSFDFLLATLTGGVFAQSDRQQKRDLVREAAARFMASRPSPELQTAAAIVCSHLGHAVGLRGLGLTWQVATAPQE